MAARAVRSNAPRFFRNGPQRWSPGFSRPPLVNAPRFFRNGPQRWSPGFSRPPLVNAPRFFRNGPRRWSPGFSRPPLVNAPRFFRNGPRCWSPGFSRPPLINAPRIFRNSRRIRLDFRPYPLRSSPLLHPWGLSAMRRIRACRSLAGKLGPILFHGSPSCLDCVSCRRLLLQAHLLDLDQEIPGLDLRAQKRGRLADHARGFKGGVGNRLGEISRLSLRESFVLSRSERRHQRLAEPVACPEQSEPDRDRRAVNAMYGMQCRITFLAHRLATGPRAGDLRPSRWSAGASVQVAAMTVTQCMGCNAASLFSRTVWPQAVVPGISAPRDGPPRHPSRWPP